MKKTEIKICLNLFVVRQTILQTPNGYTGKSAFQACFSRIHSTKLSRTNGHASSGLYSVISGKLICKFLYLVDDTANQSQELKQKKRIRKHTYLIAEPVKAHPLIHVYDFVVVLDLLSTHTTSVMGLQDSE